MTKLLTTRKNKTRKNEIGFTLYTEKENGDTYKIDDCIFIPTDDFDYILKEVKQVFTMDNTFDLCFENYINKKDAQKLLAKIKHIQTNNTSVKSFLAKVIKWFEDALKYAQIIVISGNL